MPRQHTYAISVTWVGNRGTGTSGYRDYGRDHEVTAEDAGRAGSVNAAEAPDGGAAMADAANPARAPGAAPPPIAGSSDRAFRGDPGRWNLEQLLTAALSQCHMLAYLHLCATAAVVVTGYRDHAVAVMAEDGDGGGRFVEAVLHPHITIGAAEWKVRGCLTMRDESRGERLGIMSERASAGSGGHSDRLACRGYLPGTDWPWRAPRVPASRGITR